MNLDLALVGMALIVASWLIQIAFTFKSKVMRPCFAAGQFVGVALLVVSSWQKSGMLDTLGWLNVASAAGALAMLILLLRKKSAPKMESTPPESAPPPPPISNFES